jgi:transcriptional regulator with XRE-family HTH domain
MDTTIGAEAVAGESVSAHELRTRMMAKGLTVAELARTVGVYPNELTNILGGHRRLSERNRQLIESAIVKLGLDAPIEATPRPGEPVFLLKPKSNP